MFYMQKTRAIAKCVYTEPMIITKGRQMCVYNDTFAQRQLWQDLVSTM